MVRREYLIKKLDKLMLSERTNNKKVLKRISDLYDKFNLNDSISGNYIFGREPLGAANDYMLFCLTSIYSPEDLKICFLREEIEQYENVKISEEKLKGNIILHAIQIADNQWIGRVKISDLMLWRNSSVINYNENAQRTMQHVVIRGNGENKKGRDYYQISLNQKAVNDISELIKENKFIPNTLTFNVPEDVEINYDETNFSLYINLDGKQLDILDGYHRYIALSKLYNMGNDELQDYCMEIRIVQFPESIAQQFIWQEDQKTKMRKVQSDALNQYKDSNQIVQRINGNPNCYFYNQISPNGIINKGYFAAVLNKVYNVDSTRTAKFSIQEQIQLSNKMSTFLNKIADEEPELLKKKWDERFIYAVVFYSQDSETASYKDISKLYKQITTDENMKFMFNNHTVSSRDITTMRKLSSERRL